MRKRKALYCKTKHSWFVQWPIQALQELPIEASGRWSYRPFGLYMLPSTDFFRWPYINTRSSHRIFTHCLDAFERPCGEMCCHSVGLQLSGTITLVYVNTKLPKIVYCLCASSLNLVKVSDVLVLIIITTIQHFGPITQTRGRTIGIPCGSTSLYVDQDTSRHFFGSRRVPQLAGVYPLQLK